MSRSIIQGISFALPTPYVEGHRCTLAEADILNKALTHALARGLYRTVREARESLHVRGDEGLSQEQERVVRRRAEEYIAAYTVGFAQGHEYIRAVEIEAKRIAERIVESRLYAKGSSLRDIARVELEAMINDLAQSGAVREEAEKRVSDIQRVARATHGALSTTHEGAGMGALFEEESE